MFDVWIHLLISWIDYFCLICQCYKQFIPYLQKIRMHPMVAGMTMMLLGEECVWNWSRSIRSALHSIWYTHDTVSIHTRGAKSIETLVTTFQSFNSFIIEEKNKKGIKGYVSIKYAVPEKKKKINYHVILWKVQLFCGYLWLVLVNH